MLTKLLLPALLCATTFELSPAALWAQNPQDPALKAASAQAPAQPPASPDALPQSEPAKALSPHKKVYTNDNLPTAGPDAFNGDFSEINACDRNCFEQVRQLARVAAAASPNWKRDLLRSLDLVRKDAEWQQYLRDLYDARMRFCALGEEKREELAQVADPRNVTQRELAVEEKYDSKFKQAQSSLQNLYTRQRALQQDFASDAFSLQFSQLQVSRVQNAPCPQQPYTASSPGDDEDP